MFQIQSGTFFDLWLRRGGSINQNREQGSLIILNGIVLFKTYFSYVLTNALVNEVTK